MLQQAVFLLIPWRMEIKAFSIWGLAQQLSWEQPHGLHPPLQPTHPLVYSIHFVTKEMQVFLTVPPRDQNSTFHSSHTHLMLQQMAPEVLVAPWHRSPAVLSSLTATSLWQGTRQTGACSSLREETQQGHLSAANRKSRNRECGMNGNGKWNPTHWLLFL